MYNANVNLIL